MATFIKAVLPSGRGICLEKLTTRQYRVVSERVASKMGDGSTPMQMTNRLSHEMLLASLRGITAEILPVQMTEVTEEQAKAGVQSDIDIDKMLGDVPETSWIRPTFEDLIIIDGPRSLDILLEDPSDYLVAESLAASETFGGQTSALRGKIKREYVAR